VRRDKDRKHSNVHESDDSCNAPLHPGGSDPIRNEDAETIDDELQYEMDLVLVRTEV
jgi:hypothetical protein